MSLTRDELKVPSLEEFKRLCDYWAPFSAEYQDVPAERAQEEHRNQQLQFWAGRGGVDYRLAYNEAWYRHHGVVLDRMPGRGWHAYDYPPFKAEGWGDFDPHQHLAEVNARYAAEARANPTVVRAEESGVGA